MANTNLHTRSIGSYCEGRDNNFNLIRVVAAMFVILTHSFGFTGNGSWEPLKATYDVSLGSISVDVFFVTSGFLVCRSWDNKKSVRRFLFSRVLRIYPALLLCTFLCVFGFGLVFTTLSAKDFIFHPETLTFILKNSTLLKGTSTTLPGVFVSQGDGAVNTSLWTIHYEIKLYLLLLFLGWSGWLYVKTVPLLLAIIFGTLHLLLILGVAPEPWWADYARFIFLFFAGCSGYLFRNRIELRGDIAIGLCLLCAFSLVGCADLRVRHATLVTVLPYLVFYMAYVPRGVVRRYNSMGDYSYGLYLYGAPIQQAALALAGGKMTVIENFASTLVVGIPLAVLSWHFIERRALRMFEKVTV